MSAQRLSTKRLQAMIDKCVSTGNSSYLAKTELLEYCREIYGCEPGDIDADGIIDAVLGGCGMSSGMSANDFDAEMAEKLS